MLCEREVEEKMECELERGHYWKEREKRTENYSTGEIAGIHVEIIEEE